MESNNSFRLASRLSIILGSMVLIANDLMNLVQAGPSLFTTYQTKEKKLDWSFSLKEVTIPASMKANFTSKSSFWKY